MNVSKALRSAISRTFSTSAKVAPIRHYRATKNAPGRFYTQPTEPMVPNLGTPEYAEKYNVYNALNTYVHPLSRGSVDTYTTLPEGVREAYKPGYETGLENSSSITHIINAKNLGLPPAVLQYNIVVEKDTPVLDVFQTFVAEELRGCGVAAQLASEFVTYAKNYGFKIKPSCSYMQDYLNKNAPELAF